MFKQNYQGSYLPFTTITRKSCNTLMKRSRPKTFHLHFGAIDK